MCNRFGKVLQEYIIYISAIRYNVGENIYKGGINLLKSKAYFMYHQL